MTRDPALIATQVEQELERNRLPLAVEIDRHRLVISGPVETEAERQAAIEIASDAAGL